jgi:hypothetical protein
LKGGIVVEFAEGECTLIVCGEDDSADRSGGPEGLELNAGVYVPESCDGFSTAGENGASIGRIGTGGDLAGGDLSNYAGRAGGLRAGADGEGE